MNSWLPKTSLNLLWLPITIISRGSIFQYEITQNMAVFVCMFFCFWSVWKRKSNKSSFRVKTISITYKCWAVTILRDLSNVQILCTDRTRLHACHWLLSMTLTHPVLKGWLSCSPILHHLKFVKVFSGWTWPKNRAMVQVLHNLRLQNQSSCFGWHKSHYI